MPYIKNDVVRMDWDAATFYEDKSGFIAAVHVYKAIDGSSVPVVFQNSCAFLLIDPDTTVPASIEEVASAIKECYKEDLPMNEALEDSYVDLSDGDEDIGAMYGLSADDMKDISHRLGDLSGYWFTFMEDL